MIHFKIKKSGFTLIETLVYAAGFIIILAAIITALIYAYKWYERVIIPAKADSAALAVANLLIKDVRSGYSIDEANSVFLTTNGKLSMFATISEGTTEFKSYYLLDKRIMYKENIAARPKAITPASMNVTELRFSQATTTKSKSISFSLSINYPLRTATSGSATTTFSGSGILRNTYE